MTNEVSPGTRVRVTSADGKTDLGFGTYEGRRPPPEDAKAAWDEYLREPGVLKEGEEAPSLDTAPFITLDSGGTIWGFECWWVPA